MPQWSSTASRLSSIVRRCAALSALRPGKQAHAQLLGHGLLPHVTLETDLLLLYVRCLEIERARQLFDRMTRRGMHSWNILISSYVQSSMHDLALSLLSPFLDSDLRPDHFTLPSLFKACAGIGDCVLGKELHACAIRLGHEGHIFVSSSMTDMYAKIGSLDDALKLFETMPDRDTVAWNSMISGFARAGLSTEALGLFRSWQWTGEETDWRAIPSVLNACGGGGDLRKGKEVHGRVIRCLLLDSDIGIANSLIDMYAKCGCLHDSCRVFSKMSDRNLVTWSTLVSCYGAHGKGQEALKLFNEMISQGFKPNRVTFTSVLSSCSHSCLINEGKLVFDSMAENYGVEPCVEHYACMVDLLGRHGSIEEAIRLIERMPMEPAASVWGALLAACVVHKNVEIGEVAANNLFVLEVDNPSNYIALCSIYDAVGYLDHVSKMRSRMRQLGLVKTPGCSWIVTKGRLHAFYQGGATHPSSKKLHDMLRELLNTMAIQDLEGQIV